MTGDVSPFANRKRARAEDDGKTAQEGAEDDDVKRRWRLTQLDLLLPILRLKAAMTRTIVAMKSCSDG